MYPLKCIHVNSNLGDRHNDNIMIKKDGKVTIELINLSII